MNHETIENVITNIDDRFVTEAAGSVVSAKVGKIEKRARITKILAAAAAIIIVGSVSIYAASKWMTVYVKDHGVVIADDPEVLKLFEDFESETEETSDSGKTFFPDQILYYDDYNKMCEENGLDKVFDELPGEVDKLQCQIFDPRSVGEESDILIFGAKLPESKGKYHAVIEYSHMSGVSYNIDNTQNERQYTNAHGITFTIVDERTGLGYTNAHVCFACDRLCGHITFENMTDDEIHEVLDHVIFDPAA